MLSFDLPPFDILLDLRNIYAQPGTHDRESWPSVSGSTHARSAMGNGLPECGCHEIADDTETESELMRGALEIIVFTSGAAAYS